MKYLIPEELTDYERKVSDAIFRAMIAPTLEKELFNFDQDILFKVYDKILDKVDEVRQATYKTESQLEKISSFGIDTFSKFEAWTERKGIHVNSQKAQEKLSEIIETNPNFNFNE